MVSCRISCFPDRNFKRNRRWMIWRRNTLLSRFTNKNWWSIWPSTSWFQLTRFWQMTKRKSSSSKCTFLLQHVTISGDTSWKNRNFRESRNLIQLLDTLAFSEDKFSRLSEDPKRPEDTSLIVWWRRRMKTECERQKLCKNILPLEWIENEISNFRNLL